MVAETNPQSQPEPDNLDSPNAELAKPPRIKWEELTQRKENYRIRRTDKIVTVGDLEEGDWVLDENKMPQPILHLFPVHTPEEQYKVELADGSYGYFGGTHLFKYVTELDRHMFHSRLKQSRRALRQLSEKSVRALEFMAEDEASRFLPCTAHKIFMEIAPHTWPTLPWDGSGDTEGVIALRDTINRVLEAIGPIVEDTIQYKDYMAKFNPKDIDSQDNDFEMSVEVVKRYNTKIAAQQLLLLLNPRKYAPKYAGITLPFWWFINPSKYKYAGIEIGRIVTLNELQDMKERDELADIEIPD